MLGIAQLTQASEAFPLVVKAFHLVGPTVVGLEKPLAHLSFNSFIQTRIPAAFGSSLQVIV